MVNFSISYRVSVPAVEKYLGIVLCKHRERTVKGRCVIRSLARIMRGKNVSMEVKRGLRNSILLPTLTYGSETWT